MAYKFKVYINNDRECFEWESDNNFVFTKRPIKKDFEFTGSLLDLLDLDMMDEPYYSLFQEIGEAVRELPHDENKDVTVISSGLDKAAKWHVYFELLRLDWYERIEKYLKGEKVNIHYKDLTHIPMQIQTMQNQVRGIFKNVFDIMSPDKPFQNKMVEYYEGKYSLDIFEFQPQSTNFEIIDKQTFAEVLYPKNIKDIVDFVLRNIIRREIAFKQCKSCGKYFLASAAHGNSEYCDRLFGDTGKTCKEIGSMAVYRKKVDNQPEYQEYNRAYKTHFARIKSKKMTKEHFQEWAEEARKKRDEVTNGQLGLEDYKVWLKR